MACLNTLLDYLIAYREARKQASLNKDEWACQCIKEIPKQSNGYDCGVFVCTYADYIARARPMDFTQEDMPYFRARIAVEVLNGKLM